MSGGLYELVDGRPAIRLNLVSGGGPVVSGGKYEIIDGALALRAKVVGGSAGGGGITQAQLDAAIAPLATTAALNSAIASEAQARQEAVTALSAGIAKKRQILSAIQSNSYSSNSSSADYLGCPLPSQGFVVVGLRALCQAITPFADGTVLLRPDIRIVSGSPIILAPAVDLGTRSLNQIFEIDLISAPVIVGLPPVTTIGNAYLNLMLRSLMPGSTATVQVRKVVMEIE